MCKPVDFNCPYESLASNGTRVPAQAGLSSAGRISPFCHGMGGGIGLRYDGRLLIASLLRMILMKKRFAFCVQLCFLGAGLAAAQNLAITNARVIVGNGTVINSGTVIVRGGKI